MSASKIIKVSLSVVGVLLVVVVAALFLITSNDRAVAYEVDVDGIDIPTFTEQIIDFEPGYKTSETLPFTAGAVIDIDGDGVDELFFGGGVHQNDAFYRYENGAFVDITADTGWTKQQPDNTFSSIALDLDNDGDTDLLISRQSGVWLYANEDGKFTETKLDLEFDEKSIPLSIAVGDLNRDGLFDMYVAGYIARANVEGQTVFNKEYGGISALYINKGNNQFDNITEQAGLLYQHNTFQAVFIDVDGDNLEDLVVAHDTGTVKTWKNMGNLTFKDTPNPTTDYFSYPMGIAVTDYGNDGDPDFFFSNVGSTPPDLLVRGDLRKEQVLNKKWLMFENEGGFNFNDVAEQAKVADYEFSWGAIFEDFNLDGRDDLVVSENYADFPTHIFKFLRLDGRFMVQNAQGQFAAVGAEAGVRNRYYGISPLTSDFNQDGYPDLVHVNIKGPQKVFINDGGDANYLKVKLPNKVTSIGAKVQATLTDGSKIYNNFVVGEGLCSDQSHVLILGLGQQSVTELAVTFLDGKQQSFTGPLKNQDIVVP